MKPCGGFPQMQAPLRTSMSIGWSLINHHHPIGVPPWRAGNPQVALLVTLVSVSKMGIVRLEEGAQLVSLLVVEVLRWCLKFHEKCHRFTTKNSTCQWSNHRWLKFSEEFGHWQSPSRESAASGPLWYQPSLAETLMCASRMFCIGATVHWKISFAGFTAILTIRLPTRYLSFRNETAVHFI